MSSSHATADNDPDTFNKLLRSPGIAWLTLALLLAAIAIAGASTTFYLLGELSLVAAIILNSTASYMAFTVLHEASHNAISQTRWLNNLAGQIAAPMIFLVPMFRSFRFIHMQHHRFTNTPQKDPDEWAQNDSVWLLPLLWSTIDLSYLRCYFSDGNYASRPERERRGFWISWGFFFGAPLIAWQFGVFEFYFLLYFLPTRIALFITVWAFDYLPHHGCESTQTENPFRATLNRMGLEWLLTPLLLAQNYHLVHHLYPTAPFYRYIDVWHAREAYHESQNAARTSAFGLGPEDSSSN